METHAHTEQQAKLLDLYRGEIAGMYWKPDGDFMNILTKDNAAFESRINFGIRE